MTVLDPFAVYDLVDVPKERFGGEAGFSPGSAFSVPTPEAPVRTWL
jgi:hypothetical protein